MSGPGTSLASPSPTPGNRVRSLPRQSTHKGSLLRGHYVVVQGSQNFPVKKELVNILGAVTYRSQPQLEVNSVTVVGKQPQTAWNDWAWLCCHTTWLTRMGGRPNVVLLSSPLATLIVYKKKPDLRFNFHTHHLQNTWIGTCASTQCDNSTF